MSPVEARCLSTPLTEHHRVRWCGSDTRSAGITPPRGRDPSNPLAAVQGSPFFLASSWAKDEESDTDNQNMVSTISPVNVRESSCLGKFDAMWAGATWRSLAVMSRATQ